MQISHSTYKLENTEKHSQCKQNYHTSCKTSGCAENKNSNFVISSACKNGHLIHQKITGVKLLVEHVQKNGRTKCLTRSKTKFRKKQTYTACDFCTTSMSSSESQFDIAMRFLLQLKKPRRPTPNDVFSDAELFAHTKIY